MQRLTADIPNPESITPDELAEVARQVLASLPPGALPAAPPRPTAGEYECWFIGPVRIIRVKDVVHSRIFMRADLDYRMAGGRVWQN